MKNSGIYAAKRPYPSLFSVTRDPSLARLIVPARANELNSISDYIYEAIIFENVYPWLATIFEGIANTEMRHFKMLSELTLKLGGNPAVDCRIQNIPTDISENTNSMAPRAAKRFLTRASEEEKNAAAEYKRLASSCKDKSASALLLRIAEDEELHARLLDGANQRITV